MLTNLFTNVSSDISLANILICTLASLGLGLVIAYCHRLTSRYNKNFLITLAVLPALVQIIMIMVNGNLGTSVAVLGAFSLVRFRSLPGTSKEILSIFFAMAIGLATGMGYVGFACLMTLIIAAVTIIFSKTSIFGSNQLSQILRITVPEDLDYTTIFDDLFEQYTVRSQLERAKTTDMGSLFDLTYHVTLKPDTNEKQFLDALRERNGNLRVILSNPTVSESEL